MRTSFSITVGQVHALGRSAGRSTSRQFRFGAYLTWCATGSTCPGTPTYRFWVRAPGGLWRMVRDYGAANTFTWTPATVGQYALEVDVRDQNATASYEAVYNTTFMAN